MQRAGSSDAGPLRVSTSYASRIGRLNAVNEDSACLERLADGTWLFAVADGIGGYEGGEVASAAAVETLRQVTVNLVGAPEERLAEAIEAANRRILHLQREHAPALSQMGTTLTALALAPDGRSGVAHVGDSRLYRLSRGTLTLMTRDHNVGTELVREGLIDAAELAHHPQRHMLTRALGVAAEVHADRFPVRLEGEEAFLLVTDGLIDALGEAEIGRVAQAFSGPRFCEVAAALAAAAADGENADDATVVAVAIGSDPQGGART